MTSRLAQMEHVIGPEGLVVVRLASGDVRVRAVAGDVVLVRADDPDSLAAVDIARGAHSLEIGAGGASASDGRRHSGGSADLDIDVPANASVVIDVASADIEASGLLGDQRYRSSSGDLRIRSVAGRVTAEAMSGDVEITTAGPGAFDVRTVSGDLRLRADSVSTLRATTTSGDLEVAGTFDGDGPYLMESVSGDVALEASGNASVEVRTITGDVGGNAAMEHGDRGVRTIRIGAGGPTIDIRSSSGDVTVSARAAAHDPSESLAVPAAVSAEPSPIVASAPDDLARLEILRAVERGELDIDVARERLDAIETDDAEPADPEDQTRVG